MTETPMVAAALLSSASPAVSTSPPVSTPVGHPSASLTGTQWANIAIAGATFLLALATGYMAWKTKRAATATEEVAKQTAVLAKEAQVEAEAVRRQSEAVGRQAGASEQQAMISTTALEASIQPWLTRVAPPPYAESGQIPLSAEQTITIDEQPDTGTMKIRLYLRNVGAGLAVIQGGPQFRDRFTVEGSYQDSNGQPVTRYGFASSPAVPPGEATRLAFVVKGVERERFLGRDQNDGLFFINVPYTDAKGGQLVDARIRITFSRAQNMWLFHRIEYRRDGEPDSFATVEFDAAFWGAD